MDSTMLPGLNNIDTTQGKPTTKTKSQCQQIMDYAATYPDISIRYYASDMILHVDSDAAYLVAPKAKVAYPDIFTYQIIQIVHKLQA